MPLSQIQRRFLDSVAAGEASGYDVLYGGSRFGSYADHPRQAIPIRSGPNAGKTSSAAGRYQFLAPTWDKVAGELGLTDFSPESQDKAAWHLAAITYNQKTGRDLLGDLQAGRTGDIAPSLSGVWPSLPGGIEPNQATGGFLARLGGDASQAAQAEPMSLAPPAQSGLLGGVAPAQASGLLGQQQGGGLLAQIGMAMMRQSEMDSEAAPKPMPVRPRPNYRQLQAMLSQPRSGAFSWS